MVAIAERAGFEDAKQLQDAWDRGELESPERSDRYWLEVWRWIHHFTDFQLRAVDDARFLLSRSNPLTAERIAEALHDDSVYVRVHTAQSLQRMGLRGVIGGPKLLAGLADPGFAPNAAEALGALRFEPALARLNHMARTAPDAELRLAAVRALGQYGDQAGEESLATLRAVLAAPGLEFQQAAADSLLWIDAPEPPLDTAAAFLVDDRVAFEDSERALRAWMERRMESTPAYSGPIEQWDELSPAPEVIVSVEERRAIREKRAAIVASLPQTNSAQ